MTDEGLRPERGAKPPSESERGRGPASVERRWRMAERRATLRGMLSRLIPSIAVLSLVAPAVICAQETPTEREAAKDVLQRMAALENAIDVPRLVKTMTSPDPSRGAVASCATAVLAVVAPAARVDSVTH